MRTVRTRGLMLVLTTLVFGGCSDSPTGPATAQLLISTKTTGGDQDIGYEVAIGSQPKWAIGPNSSTLTTVAPGPQSVKLEGVAENCTVSGSNPVSLNLDRGDSVQVSFAIECVTTGVEITIRTTGVDLPPWYLVAVVGFPLTTVDINTTVLFTRVASGTQTVSLQITGNNCTFSPAREVTVQVVARAITPVNFDVTCTAAERPDLIAYSSLVSGRPSAIIGVVRPDGTQIKYFGFGRSPAWSPDRTKIAYSNVECLQSYYYSLVCTGGIATLDPETGVDRPYAGGELGADPAWSPTGDMIAFAKRQSNGTSILHYIRPGAQAVPVLTGVLTAASPDWSPDGKRLAFSCQIQVNRTDLCTVNIDGSDLVRLTDDSNFDGHPAYHRDGSRIAFTRSMQTGDEIAIINASGGAITTLTSGFDPSWSSDGTRIVFSRNDGLYIMNADGSNVSRLTTGTHRDQAWRK